MWDARGVPRLLTINCIKTKLYKRREEVIQGGPGPEANRGCVQSATQSRCARLMKPYSSASHNSLFLATSNQPPPAMRTRSSCHLVKGCPAYLPRLCLGFQFISFCDHRLSVAFEIFLAKAHLRFKCKVTQSKEPLDLKMSSEERVARWMNSTHDCLFVS